MRKIVSVALILFAAAGLFIFAGRDNHPVQMDGHIKIMIATDLHYLASGLNDGGEYFMNMVEHSDGKLTEYCTEVMEGLLESAIKESPDVLVLSGDISFNGEKKSHEELADVLKKIKKAGIPVLVLPGNHDLYSDRAVAFSGKYIYGVENVDEVAFKEIYKDFGYSNANLRGKNSLSYVHRLNDSLWVLMVDSNTKDYPGGITLDTLIFVEDVLKEAAKCEAAVISVTHQNILKHHPDFYKGYVIEGSEQLMALYKKYGCVLNLSGHMHMQHISEVDGITEIVTSSIMLYPGRYGILEIENDRISYRSDSVLEADGVISKRARELLWRPIYERVLEEIGDENVAKWFADSNINYFTGRPDLIEWDESMYEKMFPSDSRSERYFLRMKEEPKLDYTTWDM